MTIRDKIHFSYAGISSETMGMLNVSVDSGLYDESFFANRSIKEVKIRGRDEPYFVEVEREPRTIPVSFYFEENYDDNKIRQVCRWFDQEYYQPLQFFNSSPLNDKIFYAIPIEDSTIVHNGLSEGYLQMNFRCNSPYAYSSYRNEIIDCSINPTSTNYIVSNLGSKFIYPIIELTKVGDGDIKITNLSNGGEYFGLTDLLDGEKVLIDMQRKYIETDVPLTYRYSNRSIGSKFIKFATGNNNLSIVGEAVISIKYQYKYSA